MNNTLARGLYIVGSRLLGERIDEHLRELLRTQWLSADELRVLQWRKLQRLVDHAYRHSPFYGRCWADVGFRPEELRSPEDFAKLPSLTKADLRRHGPEILAADRKYRSSVAKTSGSTGQGLKFYKDRNASSNGRAAMYRGHSWYDVNVGDREARLWGVPLRSKDRIVSRLGDFVLNRFRGRSFRLDESVMRPFVDGIIRTRPTYLMGYSSLVYEFARFVDVEPVDGGSFGLKMVKVTAEKLFDYQRELIERVFACPVANEYGAAEVGVVAFECPERGLHITSEGVVVEELDTGVAPEVKELLITDLDNECFPIIRYRLGDFGRLSDATCPCGRSLPLMEGLVGRTSDVVYCADGSRVHSSVFSYVLKEVTAAGGGIAKYKVYQDEIGKLDIEIVRGNGYGESTRALLLGCIRDQFGPGMHVTLRFVEQIAHESSGKLRYFVSRVGETQGRGGHVKAEKPAPAPGR